MTNKLDHKEPAVSTIKTKCMTCIRETNPIKFLVIVICIILVTRQLTICVAKLLNQPITTYAHFDFNRTILYPSVTFCREPPYKFHTMWEYGLIAHPRYTSAWSRYNFSISLDKLWKDITYEPEEFFSQYGLDELPENVEITTTIGFMKGRCYTFSPKKPVSRVTKQYGYSVTLQYNMDDISTSTSIYPPGYHVYIHYSKEPFTEVEVYNGGLVNYLYFNIGETIDVKLTVDQYNMISDENDPCVEDGGYSANMCVTRHVWDKVGSLAGCSGPWMRDSEYPPCSNYTSIRMLIAQYMDLYRNHNCNVCPRFCRSLLYNAYVNDRNTFTWNPAKATWTFKSSSVNLETQVFLYFNNLMVSVYEESYSYDWNLFLSDLGGSVGFLLGLSVIGIMSIFDKVWCTILKPSLTSKAVKEPTNINITTPKIKEKDRIFVVDKIQNHGCLTCNNNMKLKLNYINDS